MTSRGPSSEQLAWRLSGRTSWRWEPGARQVGQGFGGTMRGGLCVGKDLEGTSLPRMAELQGVCARARAHTVYVQVHLCACVHLCV